MLVTTASLEVPVIYGSQPSHSWLIANDRFSHIFLRYGGTVCKRNRSFWLCHHFWAYMCERLTFTQNAVLGWNWIHHNHHRDMVENLGNGNCHHYAHLGAQVFEAWLCLLCGLKWSFTMLHLAQPAIEQLMNTLAWLKHEQIPHLGRNLFLSALKCHSIEKFITSLQRTQLEVIMWLRPVPSWDFSHSLSIGLKAPRADKGFIIYNLALTHQSFQKMIWMFTSVQFAVNTHT